MGKRESPIYLSFLSVCLGGPSQASKLPKKIALVTAENHLQVILAVIGPRRGGFIAFGNPLSSLVFAGNSEIFLSVATNNRDKSKRERGNA